MGNSSEQVKTPALSQNARQGRGTQRGFTSINQVEFDPEFTLGARNALRVCLRVQPDEKVCVITDRATLEIAASIVHELEELGSPYRAWVRFPC